MEKLITKKLGLFAAVLVAVFCLTLFGAAYNTCKADVFIPPEYWYWDEEEQLWYFYSYWDLEFTATEEEKEQRYAEWKEEERIKEEEQNKEEQNKENEQQSSNEEVKNTEKPIDPSPKTGDGTMIIIGIAVASVSIIGIAALLCLKKKAT